MAVCMALMTLCLTACSSETELKDSYETLTEEQVSSYKSSAQSLIEQIAAFTDEQIEEYLQQNDSFTNSALESWKSAKDSLGAYESVTAQAVEESDDEVIVTSLVDYEKMDATVELILNPSQNALTSMSFNVNETMGMKMQKAGLNTLMGIGIVFLMLLFLSFLISLFRHISKLEAKMAGKEKEEAAPAPAAAPMAPVVEEDLVDDGELVAVIAAAIAASENTSTDSFVVRSIRKSNKWKRA